MIERARTSSSWNIFASLVSLSRQIRAVAHVSIKMEWNWINKSHADNQLTNSFFRRSFSSTWNIALQLRPFLLCSIKSSSIYKLQKLLKWTWFGQGNYLLNSTRWDYELRSINYVRNRTKKIFEFFSRWTWPWPVWIASGSRTVIRKWNNCGNFFSPNQCILFSFCISNGKFVAFQVCWTIAVELVRWYQTKRKSSLLSNRNRAQ